MQNKHTPDIEGIVEEFNNKFPHFVHYYERHTSGEHKLIDAKDWLRTTLKSQADKYEREKVEMVREIVASRFTEIFTDDVVTISDIKSIAYKYGVDLSE